MKVHSPLVFTIFLLVNFYFSTSIGYTVNTNCTYKGTDGKSYDLNSIGYLEFSSPTIANRSYALNLCAALNGNQPCGNLAAYICQVQDGVSNSMALIAKTPTQQTATNGSIIALQYHGSYCNLNPEQVNILFQCGSSDKIVSVYQSNENGNCSPENTFTIETSLFCKKSLLSGGDIFLIIFFCGFGAYFIIGIAIQCFRGKRGVESVPNIDFWKGFGLLIKDGVGFIRKRIFGTTSGYQQI
ncbi:hypothetical protein ACTA71_009833 [Dictyostelium dimigraforme]